MPLYLATAQGSQNSLPQAAESPANPSSDAHGDKGDATVTPENSANNTIPQSPDNSSGFAMKDGKSLKNDSGKAVLIYHEKPPERVFSK
ncbi:MAG: hypothetical protein IKA71_04505 [Lentisphaeria bacterium]|nr:hypothetical protein [Lentisphaeria bacterium]